MNRSRSVPPRGVWSKSHAENVWGNNKSILPYIHQKRRQAPSSPVWHVTLTSYSSSLISLQAKVLMVLMCFQGVFFSYATVYLTDSWSSGRPEIHCFVRNVGRWRSCLQKMLRNDGYDMRKKNAGKVIDWICSCSSYILLFIVWLFHISSSIEI